ncbi:MAG TPA: ZIP family metal transporter [Steroidobacteraceae bacterium]|nr:ZIP family metal transporter [Steroidobacteraceae bacterium]
MPLLGWIVVFTALGGIASAAFASAFLLLPERTSTRLLPHLVSFATGALLGAALLALLPEAMESVGTAGAHGIGAALVLGLGIFFVIEKVVLWRHAHSHEQGQPPDAAQDHAEAHGHTHDHARTEGHEGHAHEHGHGHEHGHSHRDEAAGVLVLIGDSVHNVLDGILISAAFLQNWPLGLLTTFAVAAHEIPHRLGDFVLLVHSGMSQRRALLLNMATGLAAVLGGIAAYFGLRRVMGLLPYALAVAAAGFLYIAVAGLIPALHRRADPRTSLAQVTLIGLGVGVIAWAESLVH